LLFPAKLGLHPVLAQLLEVLIKVKALGLAAALGVGGCVSRSFEKKAK